MQFKWRFPLLQHMISISTRSMVPTNCSTTEILLFQAAVGDGTSDMNVKAFLCLMACSPPISPPPTQLQISKRQEEDFRLNIIISATDSCSEKQFAKY